MRGMLAPTRYIPAGSTERQHPQGLGVVYTYTTLNGKLGAVAYGGKRNKADWHYTFRSVEQMETQIKEWFTSLDQHATMKAEIAQDRTAPHHLAVGLIVYNSWGYEQTNIDFYQITKVTANYIWLRPIASDLTETGFMCGTRAPLKDRFLKDGVETKHRVTMYNGRHSINFKYGCGSVYEGGRIACSWYA